jgi:hypothetical protein
MKAVAVAEAADMALEAADESTTRKAEAACVAMEADTALLKKGDVSNRALDALEAKYGRACSNYDAASAADDAASAASDAAHDEVIRRCEEWERMMAWIDRPNRLTPFPWPGDEYIEPCNARDLDYYEGRPDKCPPEVREWNVRYHALRLPECDHHPADMCDACDAAWELGTMCSAEKCWDL